MIITNLYFSTPTAGNDRYILYYILARSPNAEHRVADIAEALHNATNSLYVWNIRDEEITDIQNIPPSFAHPIRSIGKIPSDKSESELLDWLIHGESFFSKKYAILTLVDVEFPRRHGNKWDEAFEIREKEHLKRVVDALDEIRIHSYNSENARYLIEYDVIDRGQYLRRFNSCHVVDDDVVGTFEEKANLREGFSWRDMKKIITELLVRKYR